MAQFIAKETKQVFFNGVTSTIIEGTSYDAESAIVKANPSLFNTVSVEDKKVKETIKETVITEEVKVADTVEVKEELLIETPVAALEVTEVVEAVEVVEAPVVKAESKKGNRK